MTSWTSSDPAVAQVIVKGRVAGLASGHSRATDEASVASAGSSDGLVLTGRVGGPAGAVVADGHLLDGGGRLGKLHPIAE